MAATGDGVAPGLVPADTMRDGPPPSGNGGSAALLQAWDLTRTSLLQLGVGAGVDGYSISEGVRSAINHRKISAFVFGMAAACGATGVVYASRQIKRALFRLDLE